MRISRASWFTGIAAVLWIGIAAPAVVADRIELDLDFQGVEIEQAPGGAVIVTSPDCATFNEPGLPLIPARRAAILLPPGHAVASVRAIPSPPQAIEGSFAIAHAETPRPISDPGPFPPTLPDPAVYGSDEAYPPAHARLVTEQTAWGHRIAYFRVYPVTIQPLSGRIHWSERIRLEVETAPIAGADPFAIPNLKRDGATLERLAEWVSNPEGLDAYASARTTPPLGSRLDPDNYPYLIVTSPAMAEAYQSLALYESSRGLRARIMTIDEIEGLYPGRDSAERLRNFVIDAYNNWNTRYLMLGGDSNVIPVRNLYVDAGGTIDAFPGDCYYEALDGNWNADGDDLWGEPGEEDFIGELAAGRVTAANPNELANWMRKNSMYVEQPVLSEIQKALFMGERMDDVPTYACIYMDDVKDYCCDWGYCTSGYPNTYQKLMLCDGPGYDWTAADAIAMFNSGIPTSHHLGHANTTYGMKMSNGDVVSFTNDGVAHSFTFMSTQGCYSNNFDNTGTPALSEVFTLDDNCAVAFLGNTRYGWYCPGYDIGPSQHYDREFVDARYGDGIARVGDMNVDSKVDVVWQMDPWNRWCHYELCLIGDPAMPQWNRLMGQLSLVHSGSYVMGQGGYTVTVKAGTLPVALAQVTIYSDDLSVCVTATTNLFGQVTLDPSPTTPAPLHVKAVKNDYLPVTGTIAIDPGQQPWLEWSATLIDDDNAGGSVGDGDGSADMGETGQFRITLANIGHVPAPNSCASLSCDDPRIVIVDGTAAYGTIPALGSGVNLDDFIVRIPLDIVDLEVVRFRLGIACDGHAPWEDSFDITLHAPILSLHSWSIDDTAHGDGEGDLDPGEAVAIRVVLSNSGSDGGREITATLSCDEPMLGLGLDISGDALLPAGSTEELSPPFLATLDIRMPTESIIHFGLRATTWCGQILDAGFDLRVASLVEELLEEDSGWTVGAAGDNATQGTWVRGDPVGTWRNGQPVQPEDDHTPEGMACFVTGQGPVGGTANFSDVDGGKTTLLSPIFDLSDAIEPRLVYWRWYTNNIAQWPNEDIWQVDVSANGGATWVSLENTTASANQWVRMEFDLADYIPLTSTVRLRFVASDLGFDSLVEAAIDDLSIETLPAPGAAEEAAAWKPRFGIDRLSPNPIAGISSGGAVVEYAIPRAGLASIRLYDVRGALVHTLVEAPTDPGVHRLDWDGRDAAGRTLPAGLYFIRLQASGRSEVRKVVLLH